MSLTRRRLRCLKVSLAAGFCASAFLNLGGCLDEEIAKRFRVAFGPPFVEGVSQVIGDSGTVEAALSSVATAFLSGLGAVIQPRDAEDARR